jgi:hypothetical protein
MSECDPAVRAMSWDYLNTRSKPSTLRHAPRWCIKHATAVQGRYMRPSPLSALIAAQLMLVACTQFPELDAAVSKRAKAADYPALINVEPILARTENNGSAPEVIQSNLESRAAALRNRAARLKAGRVIDAPARTRLDQDPQTNR